MNILVEGWRNINHSYALVNQWQIFELIKSSNVYFQDIPFPNENWNSQRNDSGLRNEVKNQTDLGKDIDSADVIIRLNAGPIKGFEKKVRH